MIKRSAVVALAGRNNDVARKLWAMTADELQRAQGHIMLLIKTAQERVAGFLLEMVVALSLPVTRSICQCRVRISRIISD